MKSESKHTHIGSLVKGVKTWNPVTEAPDSFIQYIDISCVNRETKAVESVSQVLGAEAPSRARQLVESNDVLISTVRPNLNAVAQVPAYLDGATASTGFTVLRANEEVLFHRFLFHWVKAPDFIAAMVRQAAGANYPAVTDRIVKESAIPLPPLIEQKRIAEILDKADALREKRRQAIAKLDALVQSVFVDMFGDPATNPKHWQPVVLGDVVHSAKDGPHVSPTYSDSGIPFLSTRHIKSGQVVWEDLKYLSLDDARIHWKKCKPERGDILYTKGGTTGIAKAVDFDEEIAVWVHVAVLKTRHDRVEPVWLETMLNNDYCYSQSQKFTHGIANRDLGLKRMVNIRFYLPPLNMQKEFAGILQQIKRLREQATMSAEKTEVLFQSLQQRAFNGKLSE